MHIEQLEIFNEVVQAGSFAAVAEHRQCNPSSISRSIQALEQKLGFTLFYRSTRRLHLTEAGEVFYQAIQTILPQFTLAKQQAMDVQHKLSGTVRLTLPVDFAETLVLPLMTEFHQRYPELKVAMWITNECLDLEREHIDLAIRLGEVQQEDWVARKLRPLGFTLCATSDFIAQYAVSSPNDLAETPCINFLQKMHKPVWCFNCEPKPCHVSINEQFFINSAMAAKQLCKQGLGVALLPDWMVSQDIQRGDLVPILEAYKANVQQQPAYAWLVYPSRHYVAKKTRVLFDFLYEKLSIK